jgi:hypothetical protein
VQLGDLQREISGDAPMDGSYEEPRGHLSRLSRSDDTAEQDDFSSWP